MRTISVPRSFHALDIVACGILLVTGLALILWSLRDDYIIGGGPGFGWFQAAIIAVGSLAIFACFFPRSVRYSVLALYVSFCVGLLITELGLRLLFESRFSSAYQLDDVVHYRLRAGALRAFTHMPANGGKTHLYRVNGDGFRGEEIRKNPGTRVAVYGDSFIHAIYSKHPHTFTEQLEKALSEFGMADPEVINAGVAGYGPDQVLLRLEGELERLKPDLLIVAVYSGNDFGDLLRNKLFRLDKSGALARRPSELESSVVRAAMLDEQELYLRKALRRVRDLMRSEQPQSVSLTQKIDDSLEQHLSEHDEYGAEDNLVRELRSDPYSIDVSALPDSDSSQAKVALMAAILEEIKLTATSQQTRVVFLLIPHPIDVMKGTHSSGVVDTKKFPHYHPDRLTSTLAAICLEKGLDCINLMPVMRNGGGDSLFLNGGDDHWNDAGQKTAAYAVAELLLVDGAFEE